MAAPRKPVSEDLEWRISETPISYPDALNFMESRVLEIAAGNAPECVWLLEHPPLYTAGTSANPDDLLTPDRFPVYETGRGGQYTYHGPGQRVAYAMINLKKRGPDIKCYVHDLEEWIIQTLARFNIKGERREGRVGIWVDRSDPGGPMREDKIAAIGVRVRKWVAFHGIAVNVEPDLTHFQGIVPCGIGQEGLGVTSLVDLGHPASLTDLDIALKAAFDDVFRTDASCG